MAEFMFLQYNSKYKYITVVWILFFLLLFGLKQSVSALEPYEEKVLRGKVTGVEDTVPTLDFAVLEQTVQVMVTSGEYKGQEFTVENVLMGNPGYDVYLEQGQEILLIAEMEGENIQGIYFKDVVRDKYIYYLIALFVAALLLVGKSKGIKALAALVFTGIIIIKVMLPLILNGYNPILVSVVFASITAMFTLLIIGGWGKKTLAAVVGTISGVTVAGFLALWIGNLAYLTGFSSEEAQMLMFMEHAIDDIRGLLFAGIIIGSLGAVTDVGISIASAVSELKEKNPGLDSYALLTSGMNIGRDIMGTMANTLILAYVGSATPLLLLLIGYEMPGIKIANLDLIATEIVRGVAGSIGLVVTVPVTAAMAAWLFVGGKINQG